MKYLIEQIDGYPKYSDTIKLWRHTETCTIQFKSAEAESHNIVLRFFAAWKSKFEISAVDLLAELLNQTVLLRSSNFNDDYSFHIPDVDDEFIVDALADDPDSTVAMFLAGKKDYNEIELKKLLATNPIHSLIYDWSCLSLEDVYTLHLIESCLKFLEKKRLPLTQSFITRMIKDQHFELPTSHAPDSDPWYHLINEWKIGDKYFEGCLIDADGAVYTCEYLSEIALVILYELSRNGIRLKQCEHCGKWFVPHTAKEQYCSRITDGKTCKTAAHDQRRKERGSTSIQSKYNCVRTSLVNQKNKKNITPDDERIIDEQVESFSVEYQNKNKKYKRGELTETDFMKWLESQSISGRKNNGKN